MDRRSALTIPVCRLMITVALCLVFAAMAGCNAPFVLVHDTVQWLMPRRPVKRNVMQIMERRLPLRVLRAETLPSVWWPRDRLIEFGFSPIPMLRPTWRAPLDEYLSLQTLHEDEGVMFLLYASDIAREPRCGIRAYDARTGKYLGAKPIFIGKDQTTVSRKPVEYGSTTYTGPRYGAGRKAVVLGGDPSIGTGKPGVAVGAPERTFLFYFDPWRDEDPKPIDLRALLPRLDFYGTPEEQESWNYGFGHVATEAWTVVDDILLLLAPSCVPGPPAERFRGPPQNYELAAQAESYLAQGREAAAIDLHTMEIL